MAGIGHNSKIETRGYGARLVAWRKARTALLPRALPIEVIRKRVARAAELGLDYKAYAGIRAGTGRDIVALLFSSNALRMMRQAQMPADRAAVLDRLKADRLVLVHAPLSPEHVAAMPQIDDARRAPSFTMPWAAMARQLQGDLRDFGVPASGTVIIGETGVEAEWLTAARAAGYVPATTYFGDAPSE